MKKHEPLLLPHVGQMLQGVTNARGATTQGLARVLRRARKRVQHYESRPTLPCQLLWELSVALEHNFFADIAAHLPESYSSANPTDAGPDKRIAELEDENRLLKVQVDLLKEVLGKKI